MTTVEIALKYRNAGFSVLPVLTDGSKRAAVPWKDRQTRLPTEDEVRHDWSEPRGIAAVCGQVSGGVEVLDFDSHPEVFNEFCALLESRGGEPLLGRVTIHRTPGGYHLFYRCSTVEAGQKLAKWPGPKPGGKADQMDHVVIETRGERNYAILPGSPKECHESGELYVHKSGPLLEEVESIAVEERALLFECARYFDKCPSQVDPQRPEPNDDLDRPGDEFNRSVKDNPDLLLTILEAKGWEVLTAGGNTTYLRRPGKESRGHSATFGYCRSNEGVPLLRVFSSNAAPFQEGAYSPFAVRTLLEFDGDYGRCAQTLVQEGFTGEGGTKKEPKKSTAQRLVLLAANLHLFSDEEDNAFVDVEFPTHRETYEVRSTSFRQWLSRQFWEREARPPNSQALKDAIDTIEAKAVFDGGKHSVYLRVALDDDRIVILLSSSYPYAALFQQVLANIRAQAPCPSC